MKKIALFIAQEGFQPIEYQTPKEILEESSFDVHTFSREKGMAYSSTGSEINVEKSFEDFDPDLYDGAFLIGGPGALEYLDNQTIYDIFKKMDEKQKKIGAICISPRILAKADLLQGKKATGWDGDNELSEIFEKYSIIYEKKSCVIDGNIITANGPMAAEEFGERIKVALQSYTKFKIKS